MSCYSYAPTVLTTGGQHGELICARSRFAPSTRNGLPACVATRPPRRRTQWTTGWPQPDQRMTPPLFPADLFDSLPRSAPPHRANSTPTTPLRHVSLTGRRPSSYFSKTPATVPKWFCCNAALRFGTIQVRSHFPAAPGSPPTAIPPPLPCGKQPKKLASTQQRRPAGHPSAPSYWRLGLRRHRSCRPLAPTRPRLSGQPRGNTPGTHRGAARSGQSRSLAPVPVQRLDRARHVPRRRRPTLGLHRRNPALHVQKPLAEHLRFQRRRFVGGCGLRAPHPRIRDSDPHNVSRVEP